MFYVSEKLMFMTIHWIKDFALFYTVAMTINFKKCQNEQ